MSAQNVGEIDPRTVNQCFSTGGKKILDYPGSEKSSDLETLAFAIKNSIFS
jgi:hypothetical protein